MKELAIVGLVIFLVVACSFFAIGLAIPQMNTMGKEIVELEDKVQSLEGDLGAETTANDEAESEIRDLNARLEQAEKELEEKQSALEQTNALNSSLQRNLFKITAELEDANRQIEDLKVQLAIAAQWVAALKAEKGDQSAHLDSAEQGDEATKEAILVDNLPGPNGAIGLIGGIGLGILIGAGATRLMHKNRKKIQASRDITSRKEKKRADSLRGQLKPTVSAGRSNGKSRQPARIHTGVEQPPEIRRRRDDDVNFPEIDLNQLIKSHRLDS